MNEKDFFDVAQINPADRLEARIEVRATCVSFDAHMITLSFRGLTGQWVTLRRFSWRRIAKISSSQQRDEAPPSARLWLTGESLPITISQQMLGGHLFWTALAAQGYFKSPVVSEPQSRVDAPSDFAAPAEHAATAPLSRPKAEPTDTLMYPADARWIAPLAAVLPAGLQVSHVRRADTVAIYLRMESIRLIFLDTLVSDTLLERIREINRTRDRRIYVVGVNSARDQERTLQLFRAGWVDRVIQLPPRARILESLVHGAIGIPQRPSRATSIAALAPTLLMTQDLLLAEDLRDVLEGSRVVISAGINQTVSGPMHGKRVFAALIDMASTDDAIQTMSENVRQMQPDIRCYGVRRERDMRRDSYLLAKGWIQRFVNVPFETTTLQSLGFLPGNLE